MGKVPPKTPAASSPKGGARLGTALRRAKAPPKTPAASSPKGGARLGTALRRDTPVVHATRSIA
jgi:hypothetical protein